MRVVIAGASGLVGRNLLQLLLNDQRITHVLSVGRRKLDMSNSRLEQVVVDLGFVENFDFPERDLAFCCLGTTIKAAGSQEAFRKVDHDFVLKFASSAKAAGVKKFMVITALGSDPESVVFYNKVKGETERDLARLKFDSLVIFRPSLLLGERSESRTAEKIFVKLSPFFKSVLRGPLSQLRPIEASQVARAMLEKSFAQTRVTEIVQNSEMVI